MTEAQETVGRTEFEFPSADGKSAVHGVLWVPLAMERREGKPDQLGLFCPRGVVQLVHGISEL